MPRYFNGKVGFNIMVTYGVTLGEKELFVFFSTELSPRRAHTHIVSHAPAKTVRATIDLEMHQ